MSEFPRTTPSQIQQLEFAQGVCWFQRLPHVTLNRESLIKVICDVWATSGHGGEVPGQSASKPTAKGKD